MLCSLLVKLYGSAIKCTCQYLILLRVDECNQANFDNGFFRLVFIVLRGDSRFVPIEFDPMTSEARQCEMKLSRKQAKEALEQMPMAEILGKTVSRGLTHKQKEFARQVALGESKANAYRKAYKHDAKPNTLNNEPYRLTANPRIAREIEAYELAIESAKYRSPLALRELVVQSLVQVLVDPESSQSARISAARVLGTVTEVSAFVDRKEIKHISSSDDARKSIMDQLTALIKSEAIDVDPTQLLQELGQPHPSPTPLDADADPASPVHTIPHESTSIPLKSSTTLEDTPSPDKISPDDNDEVYSTSPQV